MITKKIIAQQINNYLTHKITEKELVNWAENALLENDFDETDYKLVRNILGQIGLVDVRAFGLQWEDYEDILRQLGYYVKIEILEAV